MLVSLFQSRTTSVPVVADPSWLDVVAMLTASTETPCAPCPGDKCQHKANGSLWSPAFYPAGVARKKANAIGVSALVFDLDHCTPDELLATMDLLSPWEYVLHSSHRHTDANPRVRIVLPLAHPVPAGEWPAFWQSVADVLPAKPDPKCKDAGHIYYLPTHPTGSTPIGVHHAGEQLDPGDVGPMPQPVPEQPVTLPPVADTVDLEGIRATLKRSANPLARVILDGAPLADYGSHDDTLNRAAGLIAFSAPVTTSPAAAWEIVRVSATAMGWTEGVDHLREQFSEKFDRARLRKAEDLEKERREKDGIRALASRGLVDDPEESPSSSASAPTPHGSTPPVVDDVDPTTQLVYVRAWDRYLFPSAAGVWRVRTPLSKVAATNRLQVYFEGRAGTNAQALEDLADEKKACKRLPDHPLCEAVDNVDCVPGRGRIFIAHGDRLLNTYVAPELVPAPGEWPTIRRVVEWLTSNEGIADASGARWLLHWMAAKVQSPGSSMPTSVIINGATASGKGTLLSALFQVLGPSNCITVNDIDSDFNAHYAAKLLVFADECLVSGHIRDVSQRMKLAITAPEIIVNQKGVQQYAVPNRSAWIFASNADRPISVERDDRRYSVFTNFERPPPTYAASLFGLWKPKRQNEPTPEFLAEMSAFAHHLLTLDVDWPLVRVPHRSESRDALIEQSGDSGAAFVAAVERASFPAIAAGVEDLHDCPMSQRAQGDGLSSRYVHAVYTAWAKAHGHRHILPASHLGRRLIRSGWRHRKTPQAAYWPPARVVPSAVEVEH